MLGGDRSAQTSLLGPELDAISERDAADRSSTLEFAPRGTALTSRLGELGTKTTGDINRNFLSVRPQAADKLSELVQLLFGAGTSLFNASTGTSGNALQALLGNKSDNTRNREIGQSGFHSGVNFLSRIAIGV